jgi:phospholipase C
MNDKTQLPQDSAFTRRRLLGAAAATGGAAMAAMALPPNLREALASPPPSKKPSLRDIEHVVLIMLENRSFDHLFGTMPGVAGFSDPDAIKLSTGRSVFYQPTNANSDGYLLPFRINLEISWGSGVSLKAGAFGCSGAVGRVGGVRVARLSRRVGGFRCSSGCRDGGCG